jgi:hypothetical protein
MEIPGKDAQMLTGLVLRYCGFPIAIYGKSLRLKL